MFSQAQTDYDTEGGVVYEVSLEVDEALSGEFDTWLRDHVADMLQLPGFESADILDDAADTPGRVRRIVQYRLGSRKALDDYLREHAERMRAPGLARFGERFTATRRVLPRREQFLRGRVSTENCLNCGEVLTGQHCSHCGQRARVRVLSMWSMLREMLGDLTNFDSRLWRTLVPLAFRPGSLTQDYLRGRRASYTPPFRMYLIVSVVFFLIASIDDPGGDIDFSFVESDANLKIDAADAPSSPAPGASITPAPAPSKAPAASTPAAPVAAAAPGTLLPDGVDKATAQRIAGEIAKKLPEKDRESVRAELERDLASIPAGKLQTVNQVLVDPCDQATLRIDGSPELEQYEQRVRAACRKIVTDKQGFGRALFANIPKMMFIFLPLMASVMVILYLGSGRYYVEHLLFFVHFHAFFFLVAIAVLVLETAAGVAGAALKQLLEAAANVLELVLVFYIPLYLYRAMRRVYGQGRAVTLFKYSVLGIAYVVCLTLTGVGLLVYTAFTL